MTTPLDTAIATVVDALEATDDPAQRYHEVPEAEAKFEAAMRGVRQRIANQLHDQGKPWREVGEVLDGLTAQRAWQISQGK